MDLSELIIQRIVAVNRVNRMDGSYSVKDRPFCALCYKTRGYSEYTQNGKTYASDKNRIVFIPSTASYDYYCLETGECIIVEFEAVNAGHEICSFSVKNDMEVLSLLEKIERMHTFKKQGYAFYCQSGLFKLLYYMISQQEEQYLPNMKRRRIEPSLSYLEKHYMDADLSIGQIAEVSGISEIYFRKLFTEIYGMTPKQYIIQIRMNKAKELLVTEGITVRQIAEEVGFNEVYSFCKAFRKMSDCTPTEYRKLFFKSSMDSRK